MSSTTRTSSEAVARAAASGTRGAERAARELVVGGSDVQDVIEATSRLFKHESFCLIDMAQVGQPIVHASAELAALTGYATRDIVGRSLGFLMKNDTEQEGERAMREAVSEGRPTTALVRSWRADGGLFWSEQRHYPIHDSHGATTHLLTLVRDVSDQVHAESAQAAGQAFSGSLEGDGRSSATRSSSTTTGATN